MDQAQTRAPFGTLLGVAPGGVPVYSSNYDVGAEELDRSDFVSLVDDIYMGYKWQCVELARRWLYTCHGLIFEEVGMAYEIFGLTSLRDPESGKSYPLESFRNGSKRPPEVGCMIIWDEGGEFEHTGHVAIVTAVYEDRVAIIEQNNRDEVWPDGQTFSREISMRRAYDGGAWLRSPMKEGTILGWVIQTEDATHAQPDMSASALEMSLSVQVVPPQDRADGSWLNEANADEAMFAQVMHGHTLVSEPSTHYHWVAMSESLERVLKCATHDLHTMFLHATDWVLQNPEERMPPFDLPRALWSRLERSWEDRKNHMITGRFDFCATPDGVKVFEYNCDSASCYMECGKVQGRWAEQYRVEEWGDDPGEELFEQLVSAWRASEVGGAVHIMYDDHPEEAYHALYMREALEAAGIEVRTILGVDELCFGDEGQILDALGERVRWVWKTWAWETALDQIRAECEDDDANVPLRDRGTPRLADVLLNPSVRVFEPLWTLIPSNKAILPVLWHLFPGHPFLLETQFELTESLRESGYVAKPIVGRCGSNIALYSPDQGLLSSTSGKFSGKDTIYQQLMMLPRLEEHYTQLCTFCVGGAYAGTCTRVDRDPVIKSESDIWPLRVLPDKLHATLFDDEA